MYLRVDIWLVFSVAQNMAVEIYITLIDFNNPRSTK